MNRYFIRVAKYLVQLTIVFTLFFLFLGAIGYTNTTIADVLTSDRGYMMLGVIALFALINPIIGYTKKSLVFDAEKRTEDVDRVMAMSGYTRVSNEGGVMKFRATGLGKKLSTMWEDEITISTVDTLSTMSGPRKEVVKIYFRMGTYIG